MMGDCWQLMGGWWWPDGWRHNKMDENDGE